MANQTIYPYGTDGQLPSSIGVINDLTTGGADKALSAEMGKYINANFSPVVKLDLSLYIDGLVLISNSNKWVSSWQQIRSKFIPVLPNKTYIVDNTSSGPKSIAILSSNASVNNTEPSYATGETAMRSVDPGKHIITMPDDASYLFVQWDGANNTSVPIALAIIGDDFNDAVSSIASTSVRDIIRFEKSLELVSVGNTGSNLVYWESVIKFPVKAGDVVYYRMYAEQGYSLLTFYQTYSSNGQSLLSGAGNGTTLEGYITIENDGYIYASSHQHKYGILPKCVIYSTVPPAEDLVVAASNTPSYIKSLAAYVCTGTNDEVILNELLLGSAILGKRIKLLSGDYYLGEPTKTYDSSNDAFLLANTRQKSIVIYGDNAGIGARPVLHLSESAYESLDGEKQYSLLAVYDNSNYGGFFEMKNIEIRLPENQKKLCAIDMLRYGGHARLHSVRCDAFTNGYNGQNISISNPPAVAVAGCIGIRFVAKGPNGSFGSEITDCTIQGFYEGVSLNTEWTVCNHVASIFCVYGWTFGHYGEDNPVATKCHPMVLLCCGDERNVNLPRFYHNWGAQSIQLIAFSIERSVEAHVPGGHFGSLATEDELGTFRGIVQYSTGAASNNVSTGFWEYGHGHGMRTTDMSHLQAGPTSTRNGYRPNYMQRYFDTTLGKEVICIDEEHGMWVDAMGNQV